MNLLLLISAMLSALTGVGGGVRQVQPAAAVAQAAQVQVARNVAPATIRPQAAIPTIADVSASAGAALSLAVAQPLFATRRRE